MQRKAQQVTTDKPSIIEPARKWSGRESTKARAGQSCMETLPNDEEKNDERPFAIQH
jgi:hypothetical protein